MLDRIKMVKRKMDESLEQLCEVFWMFSKNAGKDFTRSRKIPFSKLVSFFFFAGYGGRHSDNGIAKAFWLFTRCRIRFRFCSAEK